MKVSGKKWVIGLVLAVLVYAGIAFVSDVQQLRRHLVEYRWWTFFGALLLASGNYLFRFAKWEYYLRRLGIGSNAPGEPFRPLPFGESLVIYLSGFVMSITPGKAGEVFKSVLLASARGVPMARSAPIVVADRLTDLLSLIVLVAIGSAHFPGYGWIAWTATAMVGAVLFFIVFEGLTLRMIDLMGSFGPGRALAPRLREAYCALRVMTTPLALCWATVISVLAWALECTALWLILRGLHAPVALPIAFFTYATATIAGAIAMLPGGLGGTEFTMQQMLRALGGTGSAAAGAATLLVRIATLWFAVVVGLVALAVFRRRYDRNAGTVTRRSETAVAA
uniref:Hypothetical conserved protein n=1 Tax=uncultured delta proteobacterium TaxID=34034 RepID=H5SJE5_9DELT|nr:hypothetical conserved protein [uncultured delta proteobacterium]